MCGCAVRTIYNQHISSYPDGAQRPSRFQRGNHSETYPQDRPKESISNAKSSKKKAVIVLIQFRQPCFCQLPRIIPDAQEPMDLFPSRFGHRNIPCIAGSEVRMKGVPQGRESRVHLSCSTPRLYPQEWVTGPQIEMGMALREEFTNRQGVIDLARSLARRLPFQYRYEPGGGDFTGLCANQQPKTQKSQYNNTSSSATNCFV